MTLAPLACPGCGTRLVADDRPAAKAERFEDCLRRCESCGVGWSNGTTSPRRIWRDPLDNVPAPVRSGLLETVADALNVRNREMKLVKLASERSEDALTWTVIQYLAAHAVGNAHWRTLTGLNLEIAPTILVWGVPIAGVGGPEIRHSIEVVLDALGESPNSRTEPDVVLDFGRGGVAFVEVKYRSGNDHQRDKPWIRYVEGDAAFLDPVAVEESGRYELARNWRVACELAGRRPMALVNLTAAPETRAERARTDRFAQSLRLDGGRRFLRITFAELFAALAEPLPTWFATNIEERQLSHRVDPTLEES